METIKKSKDITVAASLDSGNDLVLMTAGGFKVSDVPTLDEVLDSTIEGYAWIHCSDGRSFTASEWGAMSGNAPSNVDGIKVQIGGVRRLFSLKDIAAKAFGGYGHKGSDYFNNGAKDNILGDRCGEANTNSVIAAFRNLTIEPFSTGGVQTVGSPAASACAALTTGGHSWFMASAAELVMCSKVLAKFNACKTALGSIADSFSGKYLCCNEAGETTCWYHNANGETHNYQCYKDVPLKSRACCKI